MYFAIGSLMTFVMIFGITENFAILYTYLTNRKIRTVDNVFIVGIALSDIGQSIFGVPFVVIASFSKGWIFDFSVCQYYAFVTTFLGISQVAMLTFLAVERYFIIVRCHRNFSNSYKRCTATITFSFLYGIGWATGPLVGWSSYEEESKGIACSVSWEITDPVSFSYTISLFVFGWFIPLILIVLGYLNIAWKIYNERVRRITLRHTSQKHQNRDRKVAITVLLMIGAFITSWLPYSVVSMWSAVGEFRDIPVWAHVAPAVFAKCSIIWNPVIYVARHSTFRTAVMESIICFRAIRYHGVTHKTDNEKRHKLISRVFHKQKHARDIVDGKTSLECSESFTSDNNNSFKDDTAIRTTNISDTFSDLSLNAKRKQYKRNISTTYTNLDSIDEFIPMETLTGKQYPSPIHEKDVDYIQVEQSETERHHTDEKIVCSASYQQESECESSASDISAAVSESSQSESKFQNIKERTDELTLCENAYFKDEDDVVNTCKYDRSVQLEEALHMKPFEGKYEGKLNTLKKRRLKLRRQLACVYSDIYHLPALQHRRQNKLEVYVKHCPNKSTQTCLCQDKVHVTHVPINTNK